MSAELQQSDAAAAEAAAEQPQHARHAPAPQSEPPLPAEPPQRRPGLLLRVHRAVKEIEPWGILLAVVALVLSLAAFWIDYSDRVEERTVRAWQLLTTKAPGNSGKIAALEYLNREDGLCLRNRCLIGLKSRTPLVGIDLSGPNPASNREGRQQWFTAGAYLEGVQLAGADLYGANLSDASLRHANLSGANLSAASLRNADLSDADLSLADLAGTILSRANLSVANLKRARMTSADMRSASLKATDLSEANLRHADLSDSSPSDANFEGAILEGAKLLGAYLRRANLSRADLKGADFDGANLSSADLSGTNVGQHQLDTACGDDETLLPEGLTIKPCD